MKIRNGFVSNSSSSSFLIYGTTFERKQINETCKNNGSDFGKDIEYYTVGYDDDTYYVGASWDKVGDKETGEDFKERIRKALSDFFSCDVKCATYQEAWYDGQEQTI